MAKLVCREPAVIPDVDIYGAAWGAVAAAALATLRSRLAPPRVGRRANGAANARIPDASHREIQIPVRADA